MTAEINPEAVERMVALVRERIFAYRECDADSFPNYITEAHEIAAMLPEPVDPLLVEARDVAGDAMAAGTYAGQCYSTGAINAVRTGADDGNAYVRAALAGIRRGRELALKARDGES